MPPMTVCSSESWRLLHSHWHPWTSPQSILVQCPPFLSWACSSSPFFCSSKICCDLNYPPRVSLCSECCTLLMLWWNCWWFGFWRPIDSSSSCWMDSLSSVNRPWVSLKSLWSCSILPWDFFAIELLEIVFLIWSTFKLSFLGVPAPSSSKVLFKASFLSGLKGFFEELGDFRLGLPALTGDTFFFYNLVTKTSLWSDGSSIDWSFFS